MAEITETTIVAISTRLREWIHDTNNALFVTKGFLEEVLAEVEERAYAREEFDNENFLDMLQTVIRNVERLDQNLQKLRKYAKEDLFEHTGIQRP